MAGIFKSLFDRVFGQGRIATPLEVLAGTHTHGAAIERILSGQRQPKPTLRDTSADEAEQVIREGRSSILGNMEQQFRQAIAELDEAERRRESARSPEPWERFVREGVAIVRGVDFESSNVCRVHYDIRFGSLFVEFNKRGRSNFWVYRYWPITEREAASIFHSTSKGIWVWDNLRIRGTKLGHRKSYQIVGSAGAYPQWTTTPDRAYAHDVRVAQESGAKGPYSALGKFALPTPVINAGNRSQG